MGKGRLEAFSDGVIAIIITIMVLEMKVPHSGTFQDLRPLVPIFLSYVLSFLYVGLYWNNHHHMLHTVKTVTGGVLWANLYLLFWLSLFPFTDGLDGSEPLRHGSGDALRRCSLHGGHRVLRPPANNHPGAGAEFAFKEGNWTDWKGKLSPVLYLSAIIVTVWSAWIAQILYATVALIWFVPDKRIEHVLPREGA